MSTKTSAIDRVEQENKNIETSINIVRSQINKYNTIIDEGIVTEEMLINAMKILEREKEHLKELEDKYPEHII
jgi:hypothetical protein